MPYHCYYRGRDYREKDYMVRPLDRPGLEYGDGYSPGRKSLGESYMDLPRRSPPRPASVGSPGRIADLSSIRKDPGDG